MPNCSATTSGGSGAHLERRRREAEAARPRGRGRCPGRTGRLGSPLGWGDGPRGRRDGLCGPDREAQPRGQDGEGRSAAARRGAAASAARLHRLLRDAEEILPPAEGSLVKLV